MRSPILFVFTTLILLTGCSAPHARAILPQERTISRTTTTAIVEGRSNWSTPISIPGQPSILIPFAIESHKGLFEKDDPYSRGGVREISADYAVAAKVGRQYALPGTMQVRWHNAVVHDMKSGQEWPILNQRGVIGEWSMYWVPPKKDEPVVCRAMLFIAVLEDTNRDGELDDLDARVAIITDADGRNPREITPRDAQVWSATFDPDKETIYLRVARDTDGDGKFTDADSAVPYFFALGGKNQAVPLTEAMRTKVEGMLK